MKSLRDKSIIAGLYLSKFDVEGLSLLGFNSFVEAFNIIGFALGVQPASIKNYRDEFDPLMLNQRKGWHKRPMRSHCKKIFDDFSNLDLIDFSKLVEKIIRKNSVADDLFSELLTLEEPAESSFAKRLVTGQAAEEYFLSVYKDIDLFSQGEIHNTTKLGCGFDFKISFESSFLGVEVKGLSEASGSILMTSKEYAVASRLQERYFLFVVKNFKEKPEHEYYQNPLGDKLQFKEIERQIVQRSWVARV
ncbi:MAG: DUF3883 domain-containing protein [Pseudomonadota bacterium]